MGGGSQSTSVTIPAWLEDAAKKGIARAEQVSGIGYTPYYGPDVAAMTPAQVSSMQGTNQMASAFGMPTSDPLAGMPTATNYGGMNAYSSGGMYDAALAELKARNPGQYDAITGMFINPRTGAAPLSFGYASPVADPAVVAQTLAGQDRGRDLADRGKASKSTGGGFTSVRDMFDGGGAGKSGTTFSGGPLSGIANRAGISPAKGASSKSSSSKSSPSKSSGGGKSSVGKKGK